MKREHIEAAIHTMNGMGVASKDIRFRLTSFSDIKCDDAEEYLVEDVLPRRGLALVYGSPKCGKSFLTLDLVMHVARGIPYRGKHVVAGQVAYIAAEGGTGFKKRIEAYRRHRHCDAAQFNLCTVRPDLIADHAQLVSDIRRQLGSISPAVIVIDTLNRTLVGSESNDQDMAKYLRACAALEDEFRCLVILVHHSGVEKGRPRGHTSLTGAADIQISVTRDKAGNAVMTVEFSKDGAEGETFVSRLDQVEIGIDGRGKLRTSCIVTPLVGAIGAEQGAQFSPQIELARRALAEVICDQGELNILIPQGGKGVRVNQWRDECSRRGIGGETAVGQRKALFRAKTTLTICGIIGERDQFVWLAKPERMQ